MAQDSLLKHEIIEATAEALDLVQADGSPNINPLWIQLKELNAIKWSLKQQGYSIAHAVYERVSRWPVPAKPGQMDLTCRCSTQVDVESGWFRYWVSKLHAAPIPHRKLWEYAYVLQCLYQTGMLEAERSAIGFGCGEEPLPSYFASKGINVTVTDLDPEIVAGKGWAETGQHTASIDKAYRPYLVEHSAFSERASLRYVDMNNIPGDLASQYDFCWSICALEHLGSIELGLEFIKNSLMVLKPGGIAVHTTELNYSEAEKTIDNWPTVLFLRRHFEQLSTELSALGHSVLPLDFNVGILPLDSFVDLPPYGDMPFAMHGPSEAADDGFRPAHLKLSIDGFPSTCFGFVVLKKPC
jgi:hypothetical protein